MIQVTESDYRIAQLSKDSRVRQDFIHTINFEEATNVIYLPEYNVSAGENGGGLDMTMACLGPVVDFHEENDLGLESQQIKNPDLLRSRIEIYPIAFNFPLNCFLSFLIDHEGYHARQYFTKPQIMREIEILRESSDSLGIGELDSVLEIPAYFHQIKHSLERKLTLEETFRTSLYILDKQLRFLYARRQKPEKLKSLMKRLVEGDEMEDEVNRWLIANTK